MFNRDECTFIRCFDTFFLVLTLSKHTFHTFTSWITPLKHMKVCLYIAHLCNFFYFFPKTYGKIYMFCTHEYIHTKADTQNYIILYNIHFAAWQEIRKYTIQQNDVTIIISDFYLDFSSYITFLLFHLKDALLWGGFLL